MNSYIESILDSYRNLGLLLDSNLSLLQVVGNFNLRLVGDGKYNKLSKYTAEDYALLLRLTKVFRRVVTTPHILTEVSNLTNDLPEPTKMDCMQELGRTIVVTEEVNVAAEVAAQRPEFRFLGLTDAALATLAGRFLVVSDDARLVERMYAAGFDALNFNHLREHLLR